MIEKIINELHLYEKKLLDGLAKNSNLTPEEIAKLEQTPVKAVTSAAGMLESKNIITVDKTSTDNISLSEEGKDYALNGLPEHRILKAFKILVMKEKMKWVWMKLLKVLNYQRLR